MNRRGFLTLCGGVGIGGGGVLLSNNDFSVDTTLDSLQGAVKGEGANDNTTQTFGAFSPGFEKIEFKRVLAQDFNGYTAEITFGAHSMDGFGIRHSTHDSIEKDIYVCSPPASTGVKVVPLVRLLKDQDPVYPNRKFDLVAYDGEFSDCGSSFQLNLSSGERGKAGFTIPEQMAPPSAFRNMTPTG